MQQFVYEALPSRVVFGPGTRKQVADEVRALGARRALVLATPDQTDQATAVRADLGDLAAGAFTEAAMHTPTDVTRRAIALVEQLGADCTVAIGGGSTTGLGKAIALHTDLPQVVLATTYAGSEVTPIIGQTENGVKTTQRTLTVLPETVIYDPELTLTLPVTLSATSGINAMAHSVEALWAQDQNPITSLMAQESIRAMAAALPVIADRPDDLDARSDALYGAWLAGNCLAAVGMALHHKLCHVLGGAFDLPHAETHAVVLPHVVAYNTAAAPDAVARVATALDAGDTAGGAAAAGLHDLLTRLGAPTSLRELGMQESGIDHAADLAVRNPYYNPRPVERDAVRGLIADAWAGAAPRS